MLQSYQWKEETPVREAEESSGALCEDWGATTRTIEMDWIPPYWILHLQRREPTPVEIPMTLEVTDSLGQQQLELTAGILYIDEEEEDESEGGHVAVLLRNGEDWTLLDDDARKMLPTVVFHTLELLAIITIFTPAVSTGY